MNVYQLPDGSVAYVPDASELTRLPTPSWTRWDWDGDRIAGVSLGWDPATEHYLVSIHVEAEPDSADEDSIHESLAFKTYEEAVDQFLVYLADAWYELEQDCITPTLVGEWKEA